MPRHKSISLGRVEPVMNLLQKTLDNLGSAPLWFPAGPLFLPHFVTVNNIKVTRHGLFQWYWPNYRSWSRNKVCFRWTGADFLLWSLWKKPWSHPLTAWKYFFETLLAQHPKQWVDLVEKIIAPYDFLVVIEIDETTWHLDVISWHDFCSHGEAWFHGSVISLQWQEIQKLPWIAAQPGSVPPLQWLCWLRILWFEENRDWWGPQ